ncbi:UNVERIFIED_CONTAM: CYTH domain-containing protein [Acetivibrio alkalicellulosi]
MGREIERKFTIKNDDILNQLSEGILYRQGYLNTQIERTVRVRTYSNKGFITVKGVSKGACRLEYEYEIPADEANEMLNFLCHKPLIEKTRYNYVYKGFLWEIDIFSGDNQGLLIAEIELESENTFFEKPPWIGVEVTGDPHYYNSSLIENPYKLWKK